MTTTIQDQENTEIYVTAKDETTDEVTETVAGLVASLTTLINSFTSTLPELVEAQAALKPVQDDTIRRSFHFGRLLTVSESAEPNQIIIRAAAPEIRITRQQFDGLCDLKYKVDWSVSPEPQNIDAEL